MIQYPDTRILYPVSCHLCQWLIALGLLITGFTRIQSPVGVGNVIGGLLTLLVGVLILVAVNQQQPKLLLPVLIIYVRVFFSTKVNSLPESCYKTSSVPLSDFRCPSCMCSGNRMNMCCRLD
jgi:hypothetical protein